MGVDIKEGGCIVVCENTKNFRSVRESYRFRALQPLSLKGYEGKLVNAFVPVGKMEIQNISLQNHASTGLIIFPK